MKQIRQFFQSRTRLTRFLCCLILGTLLISTDSRAQTWTAITNTAPHVNQGVMLLLTDGTVMCKTSSGGGDGYGNTWDKLTPNASGSYVGGTWSSLAPMASTRLYFSSQILRDGRVYVCGGEYGTGGYKGEVYNPLTNSWINTPTHSAFVSDANSEILEDGRVLQALVWAPATTKLYNPATNTYIAGPTALGSNNETAWLKLPDNSILYVTVNSTQSQRYIPATNTWISDANCAVNLYDPYGSEMGGAWLLPDGRGFFVGATGHTAFYTPSGTTAPGTWAAGPDLPGGKAVPDGPGAMMTDGKLLLAVSPAPTAANHFPTPTTFYIYDYVANSYTSIVAPGGGASLAIPCYETNMLQLPNGQVMFGRFGQSQYYVFTPAGSPLASGKPTISNITLMSPNTYRITGTRFNGICQGANYGDDWQMSTNYPVIRVVNGASTYYCRSYNWNSFGVRRGAALDTAYFTTPAGLPNATYNLFVTANGNPSNATTFVPNLVASVDIAVSSGNNPGCDGTPVTFQATPNNGGGSPTYQWRLNGSNISGATNSSYTTTTSVQGDLITCVMTASIVVTGSPATSNTITMTINDNNIVLTSAASPTSICAGASTNLTVTSNYCQPVYTSGTFDGDYVGRVAISGTTLNNITGGAASPYYTLYPASGATTATLTAGATYTMTLSAGTFGSNNNLAAWIDYNQDKSLNVDEKLGQILAIGAYPASGTIVFTVPASAKNGSVRLRVREIWNNSNLDPCKTASFGETEDYVITITGGGAASAIVYDWSAGTSPVSGTSVNASPDYSQAYTVTVTDVHGCTTSSSVPVVVNSPNFSTSSTPPTLCSGATSSLAAAKITNTYCNPQSTYGSVYGDYITLVNISGTTLNNPTGASGAPYYTLYPASGSTTTTLTAGGTYSLILSAGSYPSYNSIAAFIDYDQNSVLNTGLEKLGETGYISASPASATITFTVPLWAKNGSARLRVREVYATLGIDPCNAVFYGETEDYVLTITGGVTETPYTYAWSAGTTPSTGTPVSVTPLVTSIYTVTATDQYACTSTGTTAVVVNSPSFTVNPASPAVLCEGGTSSLSVTALTPAYCQPAYYDGTVDGDYVGNVSISLTTLDNTTVGSVSPYYTLFPASGSTTASLVAGNTYTINLSPGTFPSNNNLTAWIDYDQNGLFLSGLEKLGEAVNVSPYPGSTSFIFTVPAWAKNGTARLRVKEVFYYTNIDPCATYSYGETEDYDLTISGGAATDVYTWSAGTTPSTGDLVSVTPAYSQTYTVTATDGYGCTKTGTTSVLVNSPAFLTNAAPATICAGATTTLTASADYCQPVYSYGTGAGDYISSVQIATTTLNNATGGASTPFYTLYPASGSTTATLVAGNTYSITLAVGTYSFNDIAAWIDYDHNSALNQGLEKLGESDNLGSSGTTTFVFTVPSWATNGPTRLRIREMDHFGSNDIDPCLSQSIYGETEDYIITITGGAAPLSPATYAWSPGTTPSAGSPVTATPAYSQSYTITATDANGCTKTSSVPVVVNALPIANASATPPTICAGGTSVLTVSTTAPAYCQPTYFTGTGSGDYIASVVIPGTTLSNTTGGAPSPFYTLYPASGSTTGSLNAGSTYTITLGAGTYCCSNNLAAWIDFDQNNEITDGLEKLGETGFIGGSTTGSIVFTVPVWAKSGNTRLRVREIWATTDLTACAPASFGETEDYVINIDFGVVPTATTYAWSPATSPTTGIMVNATPAANTTYTVTATDYAGCSNTSTAAVTVIPVVAINATSSTLCAGQSTTLTGSNAVTYSWNPGGLSGTSVTVTPATTTTYTVTGTSAEGCVSTATRLITVNPLPAVGTTVTNTTICAGSPTSITGTGASTYTWNPGALSGTTINVSPVATTTYTVTGTSAAGCIATATRLITVNPLPAVGTTVTNATICAGAPTSITGTGASTYTWNPGALSGTTINVSPAATTTYTVTGTSAAGCVATATRLITVNPIPAVGTTVTSSTICAGTSTSITGTGANSYTWNPGALSGTTINVSPAATTTYTVTGVSAAGCVATATRLITVISCGTVLNLKLYIQGYYLGAGLMDHVMQNQGVAGATALQTDTITVELHNTASPYALVSTQKAVVNTNGAATCNFPVTGNYYIAVKHRNAVQTWSSSPVLMSGTVTYDFSNLASKAYNSNQIQVGSSPAVWAFYTGDLNADDNVDLLDLGLLESDITNFAFGYLGTDINGDGNVDLLDAPMVEANISDFIFSNHP